MSLRLSKAFLVVLLMSLSVYHPQDVFAQLGGLFDSGPKVLEIETKELEKMLRDQKEAAKIAAAAGTEAARDFVVVDVRSDAEVNVSVIPGAITKTEYEKNAESYAGQLVIAYCTVGGRSGTYAKQLAAKGIQVKNYKGSILEWVAAGLPLVTLEGESTNRVHTNSPRYRVPANYEQVTQ